MSTSTIEIWIPNVATFNGRELELKRTILSGIVASQLTLDVVSHAKRGELAKALTDACDAEDSYAQDVELENGKFSVLCGLRQVHVMTNGMHPRVWSVPLTPDHAKQIADRLYDSFVGFEGGQ